jgi:hypothetical protein
VAPGRFEAPTGPRGTALPILLLLIGVLLLAVVGLGIYSLLRVPERVVLADLSKAAELMRPNGGEPDSAFTARVTASPQVAEYVDVRALHQNVAERLAPAASASRDATPYAQLLMPPGFTVSVELIEYMAFGTIDRSLALQLWDPALRDITVTRHQGGAVAVTVPWAESVGDGPYRTHTLTWILVKRGRHWVLTDVY